VTISLFESAEKMHLIFRQRLKLGLVFGENILTNEIVNESFSLFLFSLGKRIILLKFLS